jgi:hypothetical protein
MASSQMVERRSEFVGRIGVAREDITPPVGIYARSWGAAEHDVAEGIHRPMTVTAMTLQEGNKRGKNPPLVLIGMDHGWWRSDEDESFIREAVLKALKIDSSRVLINLSHTHAGASSNLHFANHPGGEHIAAFREKLRDATVAVARAALAAASEATLSWSYGTCDLACDRDLPDPDANRVICGYHPAVDADDTLLVGRVTDVEGSILATVVNYACHPTTLAWDNRLISPDYVGAMREVIESATDHAPCLFLQGCSGELGPREGYVGDPEVADMNGRKLGYAALSVLEGMFPARHELAYGGVVESGAPLATWTLREYAPETRLEAIERELVLPMKPMPSIEELDARIEQTSDRMMRERLVRKREVRRVVGDGSERAGPIWGWRVGHALLIGQTFEAYSWLQQDVRYAYPDNAIVMTNLTNGSLGYLPPADIYDQDLYQVWQTPFDRGCLERTGDACRAMLRDLGATPRA